MERKEVDREQETTLEEMFASLDGLIEALESRDISLEDSFSKYREGMEILKACNEKIDTVEKKMLVLNDNGETDEF